jgi:hypothetical protein
MQTDLHKYLTSLSETLLERINGTEGEWREHWQREYQAVQRCLWALE